MHQTRSCCSRQTSGHRPRPRLRERCRPTLRTRAGRMPPGCAILSVGLHRRASRENAARSGPRGWTNRSPPPTTRGSPWWLWWRCRSPGTRSRCRRWTQSSVDLRSRLRSRLLPLAATSQAILTTTAAAFCRGDGQAWRYFPRLPAGGAAHVDQHPHHRLLDVRARHRRGLACQGVLAYARV